MLGRFYFALRRTSPIVLSLLRIVAALVLLEHGTQKMFDFPPMPRFGGFPGAPAAAGGTGGAPGAAVANPNAVTAPAGAGTGAPRTPPAVAAPGATAAPPVQAAPTPAAPGPAAPGRPQGGPRGPGGGGGGPPFPPWLMPLAGWIETVGGSLLVVGLFSRSAAFLLSGETAVVYFIAHAPMNFFPVLNGGEVAILFSWTFLYIFFAGPGPISLDWLWRRLSRHRAPPLI